MEMTYSADVDHLDDAAHEAGAERVKPDEPIRVRIQPSLFRRKVAQHRMWAGVSWTVDCATVEETIQLREALRVFFAAVVRLGPARVIGLLGPVG
jgi:hypothetical protein